MGWRAEWGHSRSGSAGTVARSAPARTIDELARYDRLGHLLVAYESVALHLGGGHSWHGAPTRNRHFHAQLVSGADRLAKLRALDAGEDHHLFAAILNFGEEESATRLCDGLDDENSRHDRKAGKVSHEKRFIDGDVLDGNDPLAPLQFEDAIDQQQGITVRQDFENVVDVVRDLRRA